MASLTVSEFGGLDLVSDPETVGLGGAIDLVNVDFDRRGRVRTRDGSTKFAATSPSGSVQLLHRHATQLIVGVRSLSANNLKAYNAAGTVVASQSTGSFPQSAVSIGTPTARYAYVTDGSTIYRWNGSVWSTPAAMPTNYGVLGLSPSDNRMVVGGNANELSKVAFSDPGAPETWSVNNYLHLTPGDGGRIQTFVTWNNLLFAFKDSGRFFVFFGTSTDSTGSPIFNYRTIDSGISVARVATGDEGGMATAGRDGVYFVSDDGVYLTTGGPPRKISTALDPFFAGTTSSFWGGGTFAHTFAQHSRLQWLNERLYVAIPINSSSARMLVWDVSTGTGTWSYWGISAMGLAAFQKSSSSGDTDALFYGGWDGNVYKLDSSVTTDDGTAIVSRYRSGFHDLGSTDEKTIRETKLFGTGSPNFRWSSDFGALDTAQAVTLGTSPAIAQGRHRVAKRGEMFSYEIGASSGAWALNRLVPILPRKSGREGAKRP